MRVWHRLPIYENLWSLRQPKLRVPICTAWFERHGLYSFSLYPNVHRLWFLQLRYCLSSSDLFGKETSCCNKFFAIWKLISEDSLKGTSIHKISYFSVLGFCLPETARYWLFVLMTSVHQHGNGNANRAYDYLLSLSYPVEIVCV